jgi:hypothetical protein
MLERAERRSHSNTIAASLSRNALRIIDKLQAERRQREADRPVPTLAELQRRSREGKR